MKAKKKVAPQTPRQQSNQAAVTGTAVSTEVTGTIGRALPQGIKLARRLTLPSLVIKKPGEVRFLAIVDALRESKVPGKQLKAPVKLEDGTMQTHEKPATICTVGDVESGEMFTFLVPAVVQSVFHQEGEGDWYVGKCFMIECNGKREGKRHTDFSVAEVDASELTAAAAGQ